MTEHEVQRTLEGHIHHHAVLKMADGSVVEGHIQPPGDGVLYVTPMDGLTPGCVRVAYSDIQSIEWPED